MLQQAFIDEMKQKLLEAKKRLEEELANLKPHEELGGDLDSNIQEVEDDEVSRDMIARIKEDLEKIEKSLGKIEAGTYGIGDDGQPIPEARLKVMPWADKAL